MLVTSPRGESSLSFLGRGYRFRATGSGVLHCHRCGGDREYQSCTARRWFHVLYIPVIPLDSVAEHVQCRSCLTRYRIEVLALPTSAQMQAALPAGSLAAVTMMLRAGDQTSGPSRSRAIEVVQAAGLPGYDEAALRADLAAAAESDRDVSAPLTALAGQLATPAPEWFLADAVRVGLADGPLSEQERDAARQIAAFLGLTEAQAHDVIWLTEEGAAAG
jgi:tellurite resistance protein